MIYVMSDIHGEFEAYKKLLSEIKFNDSDELYVLGDCLDRGAEPIKLLQNMMMRPNVFPIIGNHEFMALKILKQLMQEITEENCEKILNQDLFRDLMLWQEDGGNITLTQFQQLAADDRYNLIEYLEEFSLYEEIEVNGRSFVLVHAGPDNFSPNRPLYDYNLHELIFHAPAYDKMYYPDKYLVTGHLPTLSQKENDGRVIMKNNHIAIDCGKVYGGRLAAVRLDDLEVFYV